MSINFSEILLVLVVAVLVIKPEKLPATAYNLGKWLRWLRQTTASIKQEIENPAEKPPSETDTHKLS
jgi:Sec-independent protein translocase protein TatA